MICKCSNLHGGGGGQQQGEHRRRLDQPEERASSNGHRRGHCCGECGDLATTAISSRNKRSPCFLTERLAYIMPVFSASEFGLTPNDYLIVFRSRWMRCHQQTHIENSIILSYILQEKKDIQQILFVNESLLGYHWFSSAVTA